MRTFTPLLLLTQVGCLNLLGGLLDDPLEGDDTFGSITIDGERHPFSQGQARVFVWQRTATA